MFGLGFQEIAGLCLIGLLLFGAKRLPDLGTSLGKSIREFKKAFHDNPSTTRDASSPEEHRQQH